MPTFVFTELVNDPPARVDSACLGVDGQVASRFGDNDVGKAVKMGTANNFVLCEAGDEIEGFVSSISAEGTYNGGFSFGGVQRDRRILAEIGPNQGATPAAVLDYVVADTQVPLGTAGMARVKTGPVAAAGAVTMPATGTADEGNTGDGTMTGVSAGPSAVAGTYTFTCKTAASDGGVFSVVGPDGDALPDLTVGVAYVNPQINATINDGSVDFIVGDKFTVVATQAAGVQAAPTKYLWRIIRIVSNGPGGAGTAGSVVLLNRE